MNNAIHSSTFYRFIRRVYLKKKRDRILAKSLREKSAREDQSLADRSFEYVVDQNTILPANCRIRPGRAAFTVP